MASLPEFAALAAVVYNDQRGGGPGTTNPNNLLDVPNGWTRLAATAQGFPAQSNYDDNLLSFTAGAFVNSATGEIVISYKGTDFLLEFSGRAWNTVGDILTDLSSGVGGFVSTAQFVQAATYYQEVKAWAAANGYDANRISFTGHSLGAGIASVMSVWFNRPATVFADAPFEATASSPVVLPAVAAALVYYGFADQDFSAFMTGWTDTSSSGNPVFAARQPLVTNYYNQGEFLDYLRTAPTTIYGANNPIAIGSQPVSRALALHSMNLHAAFLFDDRLRDLSTRMPELVPALLDTKLYQADPNSRTEDLITSLVNDQIRSGFANDSSLKRFTSDLLQLNGDSGMAAQPSVRTGLIAAAMAYYYENDAASTTALFTVNGNGVHFNVNALGADTRAIPRLVGAVNAYLTNDELRALGAITDPAQIDIYRGTGRLLGQDSWHVQTGTVGMNWTGTGSAKDAAIGGAQTDILDAGAGDDILIGGAGADFLTGGTGADTLIGGVGLDALTGSEGSDYLMGGIDADVYTFAGAFGLDTIEDSDNQGVIQVTGLGNIMGAGATKTSATSSIWQSADKRVTYSVVPTDATHQDLVIVVRDGATAGTVTVRNGSNGRLGITLGDAVQAPAANGAAGPIRVYLSNPLLPGTWTFSGSVEPDVQTNDVLTYTDLAPVAHWVHAPGGGGQVITLGDGNDFVNVARPYSTQQGWTHGPGQDEDHVITGGGNDRIYGAGGGIALTNNPNQAPAALGLEIARGHFGLSANDARWSKAA